MTSTPQPGQYQGRNHAAVALRKQTADVEEEAKLAAARANKARQQLALEEPSSGSDDSMHIEWELINQAQEAVVKDSDSQQGVAKGAPKPKKKYTRPMDYTIRLSSEEVLQLLPWLDNKG